MEIVAVSREVKQAPALIIDCILQTLLWIGVKTTQRKDYV